MIPTCHGQNNIYIRAGTRRMTMIRFW